MRILLASSEVHPFSKTGGLADMVGALSASLAQAGNEVGVVTPLYLGVRERFPRIRKMDYYLELPVGSRSLRAEVWQTEPSAGLTIYFIHQPELYHRDGLYNENGVDYPDNPLRFIFLAKAAAHLARYLPLQPEVVHCHDWQTAFTPLLVRHQKNHEGWANAPRTCLTIHNLAYQGWCPAAQYALTNLPMDYFQPEGVEFYGQMNFLKTGIVYADVITTVSPRYAREITTQAMGCGLDDILRRRQSSLFGILNGVDYHEWNTTKNPHLPFPYSAKNLAGKTKDKLALQKEMGLPESAELPLFGCITRLTEQKGLDIQLAALAEMLASHMQFVLLGSGSKVFENGYRQLAAEHPGKVALRIGFDQGLSHRIEAACDFYVMPSRFEPCGLNQMYSLRYGTIPIVRITGGLDDTVVDATEDQTRANGIKFAEYSGRALARSMRKAMVLYGEKKLLRHYQQNAMKADFSWDRMVESYLQVYRGR